MRILILEDMPYDAEMIEHALRKAGIVFTAERVDTEDAFREALERFAPDVVLSDYRLPAFDGLSAIGIVRRHYPDLPVILVTGAVGDEVAVDLVKAGANDFVLKDRLARLPLAVRRVLADAEEIRIRRRAEQALERSEAKFRSLVETSSDWIWEVDAAGRVSYAGPRVESLLGIPPGEMIGRTVAEALPEVGAPPVLGARLAGGEAVALVESSHRHRDGRLVVLETSGIPVVGEAGSLARYHCVSRDITERRRVEQALQRVNRALRTLSSGNEALVRAASEGDLFHEMCRVVVERGGYRMAWIGRVERDAGRAVRPVAWAGHEAGYLDLARITWADTERGRGPTGSAVRTASVQIARHIASDDRMEPWRKEALCRGFAASVALPLRDKSGVFGTLTIYAAEPDAFDGDELRLLTELSDDISYGIGALRDHAERETATRRLQQAMEATVGAIASTVELRDPYTAGHQRRAARLAVAIARHIGLPESRIHGILLAALVHDVGKIQIPAEILSKPGKLSPIEREFIKAHTQAGFDILKGVDFPWPIAQTVLAHHERLDGSGYPLGLAGEDIPIEARVLAVADVVEAMISHRPYRPGLGLDAALAEVLDGRGRLYDAAVVDACVELFKGLGFSFD